MNHRKMKTLEARIKFELELNPAEANGKLFLVINQFT